jgi:virginiamycin B lyase
MARKPAKAVSTTALVLTALICLASLAFASRADAFVFWTKGNTIGRANLDGSGVDASFIAPNGGYLSGIALDASHVYWGGFNTRTIGRAKLDGTKADQNFIPGAGRYPGGVAVDAAHIYWGNGEITNSPLLNGGSIGRANLDGTGVEQQFIPGGSPFLVSEARSPAVNSSNIYWSDIGPAPTTIGRANLDGTAIEASFVEFPLGSPPTIPLAIAVDDGHVYWANLGEGLSDGTIGRVSIDGTGLDRNFISGIGTPVAVAVDAAHIYWANNATLEHGGSVGRANLDGTGVEPNFIPDPTMTLGSAGAVAVDSSNDFSFGQVTKDGSTGTATLTVKITEGPGKLRLAKSETVKADKEGIAGAGSSPRTKLAIKPNGKVRKRLNKMGKATVKARVTYSPRGASPNTEVKTIKLVKG